MHKYEAFQNEDVSDGEPAGTLQPDHIDVTLCKPASRPSSKPSTPQLERSKIVGQSLFMEPSAHHCNGDNSVAIVISDPAKADVDEDYGISPFQYQLKRVVEHLLFRVFSLLLIIIDICVLIADLVLTEKQPQEEKAFDITALCFVCYFILEVALRLTAKGPKEFFGQWFNVVDLIIIVVSFVVTVVYTAIDLGFGYAKLVVAGRLIRIVVFIRLWTERKHLVKGARQMVSQNKRRYQKDGFDLDLTYVTERVIAMSFPSYGKMSLYRNPIKEVARFLDTKHKDHYKVYNLCSYKISVESRTGYGWGLGHLLRSKFCGKIVIVTGERTYDDTHFHGRVERFIIDDHNVPSVKDMVRFTRNVREWLAEDKDNVIAVHCKGGKGRTGTMICIWLVEAGLFGSAEASLDYFGNRRTDLSVGTKFQGVETPSQNRYVGYFGEIKEKYNGIPPEEVNLKLRQIRIHAVAGIGKGDGSDMMCEIYIGRSKAFECHFGQNKNCQAEYKNEADVLDVIVLNCPVLHGDVKLRFQCFSKGVPKGYENCPFYFWFHTSFIENNRFVVTREYLDNPHKPKTWKVFREKLAVELLFSPPDDQQDIPLR